MVTRARKFLENIKVLEQDGMDMNPAMTQDPADPELPGSTDISDEQPSDTNPDSPDLKALESNMETDPAFTANVLDSAKGMMERYMNEEDPSWTPSDDDEKDAIVQATQALNQACESMRRFRK